MGCVKAELDPPGQGLMCRELLVRCGGSCRVSVFGGVVGIKGGGRWKSEEVVVVLHIHGVTFYHTLLHQRQRTTAAKK